MDTARPCYRRVPRAMGALRLIREAVEELAPPGSIPNDEYLGPEPMREAEAIIRGIDAIARQSRCAGRASAPDRSISNCRRP